MSTFKDTNLSARVTQTMCMLYQNYRSLKVSTSRQVQVPERYWKEFPSESGNIWHVWALKQNDASFKPSQFMKIGSSIFWRLEVLWAVPIFAGEIWALQETLEHDRTEGWSSMLLMSILLMVPSPWGVVQNIHRIILAPVVDGRDYIIP